jgi:hypothetical protein
MSAGPLQEKDPSWCGYYEASFRFFPGPALNLEEILDGLMKRCKAVVRTLALPFTVESNGRVIRVTRSGSGWEFKLTLDPIMFLLSPIVEDTEHRNSITGWPDRFCQELREKRPPYISAEDRDRVCQFTAMIYDVGLADRESALASGSACVMARPEIFSPFIAITPDMWTGFKAYPRSRFLSSKYTGNEVFDAVGPGGAKLYSIHVAPDPMAIRKPAQPRPPRIASASAVEGAKSECAQWLEALIQGKKDHPLKRQEVWMLVQGQFSILSWRDFLEIWKSIEKPEIWKRPGPRGKRVH